MKNTSHVIEPDIGSLAGKYLTLQLANELYGIEILKVQEIIGLMPICKVPKAPDYVRGVIDLRGRIIPVVEMRSRFGLEHQDDTDRTCVVVTQIQVSKDKSITVGLLVDQVMEVLEVSADIIEPPPQFGSALSLDFLMGMAKTSLGVLMLLDADRILAGDELKALSRQASKQNPVLEDAQV